MSTNYRTRDRIEDYAPVRVDDRRDDRVGEHGSLRAPHHDRWVRSTRERSPRRREGTRLRTARDHRESAYQSRDLSVSVPPTGWAPEREPRRRTATPTPAPKRRFQRPPGSQQVISIRGKRQPRPQVDRAKVRFTAMITVLLAIGVIAAMMLSGKTTEQTFTIQELTNQENTLKNQIETLNRDVESVSATAEIARRAQEMGMVVPDQPGILVRNEHGDIIEQREPGTITRPIVDINGQKVRPHVATSDPSATREVSGNLNEVPNTAPPVPSVAPYLGAGVQ